METIEEKINRKRGEYTRERRKRWLYFKNIGRIDLYYKNKYKQKIPSLPELKPKLSLWQRILLWVKKIWSWIFKTKL